jgi:hypothetical protein
MAMNQANTRGMRCKVRSGALGVLGVTCLLGSARAEPDSLDDLLGPREVAVGEAMRGGATGASAIGLNPAGLPLNRELVFEGGYGYRPSDSASLIGVSACDSTNLMPGCFFYDYAGSSVELDGMTQTRRTHVGGLAISREFVPRVLIGATTKYYDFESNVMGEKGASGVALDFGATIRMTELINIGFSAQNLYASDKSPQFPRALGGGVHARPIPALAMSFDMRWKLDGDNTSARYGGGAEYFLRTKQGGYPLRIGALRDSGLDATYISGGLGYASLKWGIDVGARHQVKNGDETIILASMRFFGPRMAAPNLDPDGAGLQ